jgi:hypothetical protein
MEFMNRGASQHSAAQVSSNGNGPAPTPGGKRSVTWKDGPKWLRVAWVVLLFSVSIVVLSLAIILYFGGPNESKQIDSSKEQAVFLTNGQVYFGKIKAVNSKYLDLRSIYYLNVNQQNKQTDPNQQPAQSNISLIKLGCELHGPVDQMVINRDQVTFWENLKSDGQVAKAISQWVKQNPNGQSCKTS